MDYLSVFNEQCEDARDIEFGRKRRKCKLSPIFSLLVALHKDVVGNRK